MVQNNYRTAWHIEHARQKNISEQDIFPYLNYAITIP